MTAADRLEARKRARTDFEREQPVQGMESSWKSNPGSRPRRRSASSRARTACSMPSRTGPWAPSCGRRPVLAAAQGDGEHGPVDSRHGRHGRRRHRRHRGMGRQDRRRHDRGGDRHRAWKRRTAISRGTCCEATTSWQATRTAQKRTDTGRTWGNDRGRARQRHRCRGVRTTRRRYCAARARRRTESGKPST